MSLRNLRCFTTLATIVGFAVAGSLNRHAKELDVGQSAKQQDRSPITRLAFVPVQSAAFVLVQSNDAKDLGPGKLLVASRRLADPNFAKTVILLIHYDDKGVVGLILNRRTEVALSRVLQGIQGAKDRSDPAYLGGPVEVPAVFALLQSTAKFEGAEHIFNSVYLISTKALLEQTLAAQPDPQSFHVYLGYAGWTRDQLQNEVEHGAWFIFPADRGAVFSADPGSLWPQMIRKTELNVAQSDPASADGLRNISQ